MRKLAHLIKNPEYFISLAIMITLMAVFLPSLPVLAAPVIILTPSSGAVGTNVTISGTVFDSYKGDSIHIFFGDTEIQNSPTVVPDNGAFTISFTIPANATAGQHWVEAKSETTSTSMIAKNTFTVDATSLTLATTQGCVGDTINISGSGYYVGKPITIYYMNLTKTQIGTTTASDAGRFTFQLVIPVSAAGSHSVIVSNDMGNSAEASFKVLPQLKLASNSAGPGDAVSASGTGFAATSTVNIFFGTSNVGSTKTDNLGNFKADFTVPTVKSNSYSVSAQDSQGNSDSTQFNVTAGATLSKSVGNTGSDLTVTGSGFTPGHNINVYYDDALVATVVADSKGDFTATFTIPAGGGNHVITVSDGTTTKKYTFALEKTPPPVPTLIKPDTNSFINTDTIFDWSDVTDASVPVTYNLQIASDQNFATLNLNKTGIKTSQYTPTADDITAAAFKSASYFWRVKAIDGAGNEGTWSAPWVFFLTVPSAPTLTLPAPGTSVQLPIHFSWQSSTSVNPPLTYNLQIAHSPDFTSPNLNKNGITATEYLASDDDDLKLENNATYYWRVKAVDNAHNSSDWSTAGSFQFIATSGFPHWATYTLISIGGLLAILLAFRAGRRTAYH